MSDPCAQAEPPPEMEEGQIALDDGSEVDEELEEGQIGGHALTWRKHTAGVAEESRSSDHTAASAGGSAAVAEEEEEEDEHELGILLNEPFTAPAANAASVFPSMLQVRETQSDGASQVGCSQSLVSAETQRRTACLRHCCAASMLACHSLTLIRLVFCAGTQWSLPLPVRPPQAETASDSDAALTAEDRTRTQLLALHLPAAHIDAVLQQHRDTHSASAATQLSLDAWVNRVMESMYKAEHAEQANSNAADRGDPAAQIATIAIAPKSAVATSLPVAIESSPAVLAVAAAESAVATCGICWDPLLDDAHPSVTSCHVSAHLVRCKCSNTGKRLQLTYMCVCVMLLHLQHAFCSHCWNGYLSSKVLDGAVISLRCPHANPSPCSRVLDAVEVKERLSTPAMREQYDRLAALARVAQDPTVRWCPTPNCETVLRGGSSSQPHLACTKCHAELCFKCSERWHPGVSCADASAASLSHLLAAAPPGADSTSHPDEIKRCPNCSMGIIRASGCNFLRCSRCGFEFCWICLSEYTEAHFACQARAGAYRQCETLELTNSRSFYVFLPLVLCCRVEFTRLSAPPSRPLQLVG